MRTIFALPDDVVAQVAAGEVIEWPASVVKELVENALDAGATDILVDVTAGGRDSIIVTDNGRGIEPEDFPWLVERHATSKLSHTEDLFQLQSYGFRGEALASLAAVSDLTIQSKPSDQLAGRLMQWRANRKIKETAVGMAAGTRVEVHHIFADLPARRKFLRPAATEWRHIIAGLSSQALVTPHVRWLIKHNGEDVLHLPPQAESDQRVAQVLGTDLTQQLLPVDWQYPHLGVTGWIGRPPLGTSRPLHQYLFVNRRWVKSRLIQQVVKNAYQHYLDPRSQPVFCLFLTLPTETVDINIHPRKETVTFLNEGLVAQLIEESIGQALGQTAVSDRSVRTRHQALIDDAHTQTYAGQLPKEVVLHQPQHSTHPEPIIQINNLVLAVPSAEGLLLIDQHAAHERILYEQFRQAYEAERQKKAVTKLTELLTWTLNAMELALIQEHQDTLEQLGFSFNLKKSTLTVTQVPTLLRDRNIKELFQEALSDLANTPQPRSVDTPTQLMLAYLACRSAIKGGQYLSPQERQDLLTQLAQLGTNYTCPHGRPVQVVLDNRELEKFFHR